MVATMNHHAVGISYHHLYLPGPCPESHNAAETLPFAALNRLAAAGFDVDMDGGALLVKPAGRLSATQREWLAGNKAALLAALSATRWRWCVEWPDGRRYVVDYVPAAHWRRVSGEYPGAAAWPAPDGFDVAAWMAAGKVAS